MMAGEEVGDVFIEGRTYDVQVWSIPEARHSIDSVRDMLISTPDGAARPAGGCGRCQHPPNTQSH